MLQGAKGRFDFEKLAVSSATSAGVRVSFKVRSRYFPSNRSSAFTCRLMHSFPFSSVFQDAAPEDRVAHQGAHGFGVRLTSRCLSWASSISSFSTNFSRCSRSRLACSAQFPSCFLFSLPCESLIRSLALFYMTTDNVPDAG